MLSFILLGCASVATNTYGEVHNLSNRAFATQVYLLTNSDEFIGDTVHLQGLFDIIYDDITNESHYFAYRYAVGCCTSYEEVFGFKLHLNDLDHPPLGSWVEVYGVLEKMQEGGRSFFRLNVVSITEMAEQGIRVVPPLRRPQQ